MENSLVLLLLLTPFVGFLFNVFFGKKAGKNISGAIGTIAVVVSFAMSVYFFMQLNTSGKAIPVIRLFDWIQLGNLKIDFGILLDQLSLLWLLFVTSCSADCFCLYRYNKKWRILHI